MEINIKLYHNSVISIIIIIIVCVIRDNEPSLSCDFSKMGNLTPIAFSVPMRTFIVGSRALSRTVGPKSPAVYLADASENDASRISVPISFLFCANIGRTV